MAKILGVLHSEAEYECAFDEFNETKVEVVTRRANCRVPII